MPPKQSKKEKGAKKGDSSDDGDMSVEDRVAFYRTGATSLQLQLADRTDLMNKAAEERKALEECVAKISAEFEEEQKTAFTITKDMTRQYKGMQEQLVDHITELSRTIQVLQDRLEEAEQQHLATIQEKDEIILLKNKEINEMKAKMEDMAQEFGGMLKETLDKMRQRIEISSNTIDANTKAASCPVLVADAGDPCRFP
mmetsp:Transcript_29480/g.95039  ORF Transcript_29480/g.95039 Transcript_29480/m.95039 type:complete len:199 (-) Transcript_29480:560-1156(-)|eukprot:CAMPEP_0118889072 /NCGR_PEP_ID=MMETSP1166-20130328/174_1 /TAXON_ID=1104430 /ORGANISM="Chrysoreinhardia sp, Strain CCMP3193" /LENGTH=198 /DNA_ID=CAMNT_0006827657 /DNA_START=394 /DNA_END=990 /DNA_ORIENTATION=+